MEQYAISEETNAFVVQLFKERGIKFLYDLSIAANNILKKEINKYTTEEDLLPIIMPEPLALGLGPEDNLYEVERKLHQNFYRKYVDYGKVKLRIDQTQKARQETIEKELCNRVNKLSYGELITLAFDKSQKNLGNNLLGSIYFQVKELTEKHKVHLDPDVLCPMYYNSEESKISQVINQMISPYARISVLGIIEYILDRSIKEIEGELDVLDRIEFYEKLERLNEEELSRMTPCPECDNYECTCGLMNKLDELGF